MAPHLVLLALLLASCCRSSTTKKRQGSDVSGQRTPSAETPLEEKLPTLPPAAASIPAAKPATNITAQTTAAPSTNPSSQQPGSSSPMNSAKRKRKTAASSVPKPPSSSNAEDDMIFNTGKKLNTAERQGQPDEDRMRPDQKGKERPEDASAKKRKEKIGEDTHKVEQKTQDGDTEAAKTPDQSKGVNKAEQDPVEQPKKKTKDLPFFSRERIKRKLGMKSSSEKVIATKPKAPVKRPMWQEAVPESQLPDDLTDFDANNTHKTQDDTKETVCEPECDTSKKGLITAGST